MSPKQKRRTSNKRSGGTPSKEKQQHNMENEFGDFVANLPTDALIHMAQNQWNKKGSGPKFNETFAKEVIQKAGFFPVCWDLDKDLYPFLKKNPKYADKLHFDLAKEYIKNRPEKEGVNSLIKAIENENIPALKGLLNSGVNVNFHIAEKEDETALHIAATLGCEECLKWLLQAPGVQVNALDDNRETPLHRAALNGHVACLRLLLNAPGVKVNVKDDIEWTPLHCATLNGHVACLQLLLKVPGVEVNARDNYGSTPLYLAAWEGHEACLRLLLQAPGVEVHAVANDGWTPLHRAAGRGHEACLLLLLKADGVQVNAANNKGWTPLYWAALSGHVACVEILLQAPGVNVNAADNNGKTPLDVTQEPAIKKLLKEAASKAEKSKEVSSSSGGKPKAKASTSKDCITYADKKYMVHIGSKGGKYILVGAEKKKVYIRN